LQLELNKFLENLASARRHCLRTC